MISLRHRHRTPSFRMFVYWFCPSRAVRDSQSRRHHAGLACGRSQCPAANDICRALIRHRACVFVRRCGCGGGSGLQGFDTAGGVQLMRATGTFGQVNEQAIFHTVMTIPLLALLGVRNAFVRSAAGIAVVGCSALAIVLTFSRGAWLAFPVGLAVCGSVALRRGMIGPAARRAGAILGLTSGFALLLLAQPIYQRLAFGDNGATNARIRLAVLAMDLFKEYPILGVGPGEFDEAALRLYPPGSAATSGPSQARRQTLRR